MEQEQTALSWRERDFSSIQEYYINSNRKITESSRRLITGVYCLFGFPFFIIFPLLFLGRKYKYARWVFKALHIVAFVSSLVTFFSLLGNMSDAMSAIGYFILTAYIGVMTVIGFYSVHPVKSSKLLISDSINTDGIVDNKVFGVAGDLSSARGKFSDINIEQGEEGEKRTAKMLEELLRIPGTRIFHGAIWPGTDSADIDHIVINGRKIAFVDSKLWSQGLHVADHEGNVLTYGNKEGKPIARNIKIHKAAESYMSYIRRHGIHNMAPYSWVAVHNKAGTSVKTKNAKNRIAKVSVLDAEKAIDDIGSWFADDVDGIVFLNLMDKMKRMLR